MMSSGKKPQLAGSAVSLALQASCSGSPLSSRRGVDQFVAERNNFHRNGARGKRRVAAGLLFL